MARRWCCCTAGRCTAACSRRWSNASPRASRCTWSTCPGTATAATAACRCGSTPCVEAIAAVVPRAPWCGWSLGGLVALQAAASRPKRCPRWRCCARARASCARRLETWRVGRVFRSFADGLRNDYRGTLELFVALGRSVRTTRRTTSAPLRGELFARRTRGRSARHGAGTARNQRPARRVAGAVRAVAVDRRAPRPAGRSARDAGRRRARAERVHARGRARRACAVPHPCGRRRQAARGFP